MYVDTYYTYLGQALSQQPRDPTQMVFILGLVSTAAVGHAPEMKLSPRDSLGYIARPDPSRPGILLFGADAMRVAERRIKIIANLTTK